MDRDSVSWHGYWPAAPTPFEADGELAEQNWRELLELYVSQGVNGVLVNGSTGEWFSQTERERRRVAEIAVQQVAGRIPVIIGVTSYTGREAADLARHAADIGADGVLATPPPYVHPSAEEIVAFYAKLSRATDLPFMVYNWPRGVAVDMAAEPGLMQRLADLPQVAAIKDSTSNWLRMVETIEAVHDQVRVFGSFLHRKGLAILLGLGGDGNIDGGGLGAPFAVPYYQAVWAGDAQVARQWVDKYAQLSGRLVNLDYSGVFASPIPQLKAAMAMAGQPGGHVREPLLALTDPDKFAAIRTILTESGLMGDA